MKTTNGSNERILHYEEKKAASANGMLILLLNTVLLLVSLAGFILGLSFSFYPGGSALAVLCGLYLFIIGP
ncbi:MAG: hypothetical protein PHQ50_05200, partial [Eubacteriales bacterium]|nr:hypothetical protein [Eubacteriales bacterium]